MECRIGNDSVPKILDTGEDFEFVFHVSLGGKGACGLVKRSRPRSQVNASGSAGW